MTERQAPSSAVETSDIDGHVRQLQILHGALLLGVALFAAVTWYVVAAGMFAIDLGDSAGPLLRFGFLASVLPVLAGVTWARGSDSTRLRVDPQRVLERHRMRSLIGAALCEAGGLMGILLGMLTGFPSISLALGGLSILGMLLAWPRREALRRALANRRRP